jgi:hypothetical protein
MSTRKSPAVETPLAVRRTLVYTYEVSYGETLVAETVSCYSLQDTHTVYTVQYIYEISYRETLVVATPIQ